MNKVCVCGNPFNNKLNVTASSVGLSAQYNGEIDWLPTRTRSCKEARVPLETRNHWSHASIASGFLSLQPACQKIIENIRKLFCRQPTINVPASLS